MRDLHYSVYLKARAYWSERLNDIHIPIAYLHGRELLLAYPEADADIVIPAILLHDIGWGAVNRDQQSHAYGPTIRDRGSLRLHEVEGARIADALLRDLNYDVKKRHMIVRIIDGHDTRLESLSIEDSLVKDADKIWRFTPVGVDFLCYQRGAALAEVMAWLIRSIDEWFFTERGRQLARESLMNIERALGELGHV